MASARANPPGSASASNQNIPQQHSHEGGFSSSTQDPGGCLTSSLAEGNGRQPAVRNCRVDYLSCPDLSLSLEVKSNITRRTYSSVNTKSHEIHCKTRNYIYLLTCKICSIQYVGENITPVNLRINIHRKGKSGCEHSINHYENICKGASFSIHILEKLEGYGFINGQQDFAVQKLCLQREVYWMKKLCTIYPYDFNEAAKNSNLEQPTGTLFPPLSIFSNRRENLEKRRVNEPTKFDTTDTLLAHIGTFPPKNRRDNFHRILEGMDRKDVRKLASNATDELKTCDDTKKRWCELFIDISFTKVFTTEKKVQKKRRPFAISGFFP